jgi:transketolase
MTNMDETLGYGSLLQGEEKVHGAPLSGKTMDG